MAAHDRGQEKQSTRAERASPGAAGAAESADPATAALAPCRAVSLVEADHRLGCRAHGIGEGSGVAKSVARGNAHTVLHSIFEFCGLARRGQRARRAARVLGRWYQRGATCTIGAARRVGAARAHTRAAATEDAVEV